MLCGWDHCVILGGCLFFLEFMQQWLPGFAELESPISVDVIWMHLNFDGFSVDVEYVIIIYFPR